MIEWFKNLSEGWQTAVFGAVVTVGLAVIAALFTLFKWLIAKKESYISTRQEIRQAGKEHMAANIDGDKNIIAGGNIHAGVDAEVVSAALKVLLKVLEMVNTDQSNKLASNIKHLSDGRIDSPIEPVLDKYSREQKVQLEKEFQLYGELWKALVDVRSSIIITPTLDMMPKGKSPYDVYKDRCDTAIDAFNKAKNLFETNRPFYHDDVSKITKEFLGRCRGYIFKVQRALSSKEFDDRLHDEADELHEIIPMAVDEIEKAIKVRIGLLPKSNKSYSATIGPGLGPIVEITSGSITYHSNTLSFRPLEELKTSIIGGYVKRTDSGKLEAYIQTDVQVQSLQRLNEKLGLDSMHLFSENDTISEESDNPVIFTSSTSHILPQGENILNLSTWQEAPFPITVHVQTETTASGHLKGKIFQGQFEAVFTYREINLKIGLNGEFQVHLA